MYPLYDELKALRGLNGVKDHLSYVRAKQEAYSKRNIAKYLKKAIEQYLPTVKRQDIDVYPLYDELKALRGLNGVKDHLSYVRAKQEAYSKRNIAKYLKKAIEQYLPTVKRQDIENE